MPAQIGPVEHELGRALTGSAAAAVVGVALSMGAGPAPTGVVDPHVGSLTRFTYRDICVRSVRNVLAILRGDEPEAGCMFNAARLI
jgi:hypothetical protein